MDVELQRPVDANENRCRPIACLDVLVCCFAVGSPVEWPVLPCESGDRLHDGCVVFYKTTVELGESIKGLDRLDVFGCRHVD